MKRSLIAFQALLASSAVLCQTAEASSTYTAPEHLNGPAKANSIEARIEAVRNTDWGSLLKDSEMEGGLVAKGKWGNGKGNKWSDGSNSKVADEKLQPPVGTGRMFGPFPQVPGKSISQVNFRIGANNDPAATGFSCRISVQGCH